METADIQDVDVYLPEGTLVEVTMMVRLPCPATEAQVESWINYNVARRGGINIDNPLYSQEPEAWGPSGMRWNDTGEIGTSENFDHKDLGGGRSTYRTRYRRQRRV